MKSSNSEKENVDGVRFPCPTCGNEITRSTRSRHLSIEYTCSKCNRKGP